MPSDDDEPDETPPSLYTQPSRVRWGWTILGWIALAAAAVSGEVMFFPNAHLDAGAATLTWLGTVYYTSRRSSDLRDALVVLVGSGIVICSVWATPFTPASPMEAVGWRTLGGLGFFGAFLLSCPTPDWDRYFANGQHRTHDWDRVYYRIWSWGSVRSR